jgi:hypothetical protein
VKSALALKLSKKFEELTAAEEEKTPSAPLVKMDEKYEIKWLDGPLGISLIASKDAPYPLVTRITGKNRSPQVQDVQPGHYLVQIGTYNTADGNFNTAIKYLQKVSKPVSLFFCPSNKKVSARPDASMDEYDHVWEKKQPLCFTVRPDEKGRMVVADVGSAKSVKLKPKGPPGSNTSVGSGDVITWINDESTGDLSFHEALLKLRTAKRPLVIRFKNAPPEPPVEVRAPVPAPVPVPPPPPPAPVLIAPMSNDSSTSQPGGKPPGRFNPLKKIAAYAKENSLNALNQRNHAGSNGELKKTSPGLPVNKKSILSASDVDARNDHHHHLLPTKSAATIHHATTSNTHHSSLNREADSHSYHHPTTANGGDAANDSRRTDPPPQPSTSSKLINLDLFPGLRKPLAGRSGSDPSLPTSSAGAADNHAPPPSRMARNSGGRPVEHPPLPPPPPPPAAPTPHDDGYRSNHTPPSSSTTSTVSSSSSSPSLPDRPDEYEVIWPEGTALGLTLRVHPTTRFPVVARVTGTSNLKNIEHVTPGDVLFQANGAFIVPQPKFKQTLENLSRLPKPAVLRFRRGVPAASPSSSTGSMGRTDDNDRLLPRVPSALRDHEYELIWRENSNLGLVFSSDGDVPRVSKVDPESGGPNVAVVSVGDTLTCIGPMEIGGSSFHSSMATLRAVKRPVVLRFQRNAP